MRRGLTISCVGHAVALAVRDCDHLGAADAGAAGRLAAGRVHFSERLFQAHGRSEKCTQAGKRPSRSPTRSTRPSRSSRLLPRSPTSRKSKPTRLRQSSQVRRRSRQQKPDKKQPDDFKADQIAQVLKKDDAKKPQDKPTPLDKPTTDSPKFDANQVAALLDKRDPQPPGGVRRNHQRHRQDRVGSRSSRPTVAERDRRVARAHQPMLESAGWRRRHVQALCRAPRSVQSRTAPWRMSRSWSKAPPRRLGPALAESAKRALLLCQPFTMLKPEHYDQWKDIEIKFDPPDCLAANQTNPNMMTFLQMPNASGDAPAFPRARHLRRGV